ncbi:AraC family transcriptional regulator [Xanthobacter sp. VNH20]|uniref:AraC family transcriptional regulator n=1 Tax=Xanthobacter sp. VNH20 TaxID=3156616 RepID=UPI0032B6225D
MKQIWSGTLPECVTLSIQAGESDHGDHGEMDLLETALGQDSFVSQLAALLASDMSCANHVPNGTVWTSARRALVAHVWRRYSKSTSPEPNTNSISGPKLTHVIDFVGAHLDEGISLDQMAAVAGMGRFHFSRMFKAAVGLTPMAFVERARIERAKTLIGEGRLSLAEIGSKVGFEDKSHFTRRFRRHTGLSPREFLKKIDI